MRIFSQQEDAMNNLKEQLTRWIDEDRDKIIDFLCDFVRAKSPNPPGDTTLAAAHVASFLEAHALPFRVIAPQPTMPNIVGSFTGPTPGRHLVLNGHMDVFPVDEQHERWTHGPWSGAMADGKIYGRGVADMKAGTSASVFTYYYLCRIRDHLKGRLTLTAVSDEETFGPWGARYLMEHHPEVHGDCLLNGEPSSPRRPGRAAGACLAFWWRSTLDHRPDRGCT
jgi:succinyl-diaminopimelate desuccinylase